MYVSRVLFRRLPDSPMEKGYYIASESNDGNGLIIDESYAPLPRTKNVMCTSDGVEVKTVVNFNVAEVKFLRDYSVTFHFKEIVDPEASTLQYIQKKVVEAFKWTADINQTEDPEWICEAICSGNATFINLGTEDIQMHIVNDQGLITSIAHRGDYIINDPEKGIYACRPQEFKSKFKRVSEEN